MTLDKLFSICGHCNRQLANPVYSCPWCNWPREHTEETPAPIVGLPDNSFKPGEQMQVSATSQQGAVPVNIIADVTLAPPKPPQAPAQLVIPEFEVAARPSTASPRTLTLAPEEPAAPLETPELSEMDAILAELNAGPKKHTHKRGK